MYCQNYSWVSILRQICIWAQLFQNFENSFFMLNYCYCCPKVLTSSPVLSLTTPFYSQQIRSLTALFLSKSRSNSAKMIFHLFMAAVFYLFLWSHTSWPVFFRLVIKLSAAMTVEDCQSVIVVGIIICRYHQHGTGKIYCNNEVNGGSWGWRELVRKWCNCVIKWGTCSINSVVNDMRCSLKVFDG